MIRPLPNLTPGCPDPDHATSSNGYCPTCKQQCDSTNQEVRR